MKSEQIKAQFQRRRLIMFGSWFLMAIACLLSALTKNTQITIGVFLSTGIVYAIASSIYWRCPACNKYLGRNAFPSCCPNCKQSFL